MMYSLTVSLTNTEKKEKYSIDVPLYVFLQLIEHDAFPCEQAVCIS
jgi:hypothetical protein